MNNSATASQLCCNTPCSRNPSLRMYKTRTYNWSYVGETEMWVHWVVCNLCSVYDVNHKWNLWHRKLQVIKESCLKVKWIKVLNWNRISDLIYDEISDKRCKMFQKYDKRSPVRPLEIRIWLLIERKCLSEADEIS